ncbi:MAG: DUF3325 domain-containing protein [Rhodospirillales bacterium]|nr:DUF3325 domain-containing protein [Rhodospirillales bacterium]
MTALNIIAAILCAFAGLGALAMAMARHARDVFGRTPERRTAWSLRIFGMVMLCAAYAFSVYAWGPKVGPVGWFGVLSAAALAVVTILAVKTPAGR